MNLAGNALRQTLQSGHVFSTMHHTFARMLQVADKAAEDSTTITLDPREKTVPR